mmetsp:Transcript_34787/g.95948  ORF Transcript_34787/g.95948 Transcript_34787/m.95948 type:complete len:333 (+) Transcript_34787:565-1563(+)
MGRLRPWLRPAWQDPSASPPRRPPAPGGTRRPPSRAPQHNRGIPRPFHVAGWSSSPERRAGRCRHHLRGTNRERCHGRRGRCRQARGPSPSRSPSSTLHRHRLLSTPGIHRLWRSWHPGGHRQCLASAWGLRPRFGRGCLRPQRCNGHNRDRLGCLLPFPILGPRRQQLCHERRRPHSPCHDSPTSTSAHMACGRRQEMIPALPRLPLPWRCSSLLRLRSRRRFCVGLPRRSTWTRGSPAPPDHPTMSHRRRPRSPRRRPQLSPAGRRFRRRGQAPRPVLAQLVLLPTTLFPMDSVRGNEDFRCRATVLVARHLLCRETPLGKGQKMKEGRS